MKHYDEVSGFIEARTGKGMETITIYGNGMVIVDKNGAVLEETIRDPRQRKELLKGVPNTSDKSCLIEKMLEQDWTWMS